MTMIRVFIFKSDVALGNPQKGILCLGNHAIKSYRRIAWDMKLFFSEILIIERSNVQYFDFHPRLFQKLKPNNWVAINGIAWYDYKCGWVWGKCRNDRWSEACVCELWSDLFGMVDMLISLLVHAPSTLPFTHRTLLIFPSSRVSHLRNNFHTFCSPSSKIGCQKQNMYTQIRVW